jgi:hypothetical protein
MHAFFLNTAKDVFWFRRGAMDKGSDNLPDYVISDETWKEIEKPLWDSGENRRETSTSAGRDLRPKNGNRGPCDGRFPSCMDACRNDTSGVGTNSLWLSTLQPRPRSVPKTSRSTPILPRGARTTKGRKAFAM